MNTRDRSRDPALDAVKGFLILVMIIYHAMNHFQDISSAFYGYLRFVNGSFVFISGYIVAVFYRGQSSQQNVLAARRLMFRGVKLLALFTALNLLIGFAGLTNYRDVTFGVTSYLENVARIYGSGDLSNIAFRILMPIAYVLAICGILLLAIRWSAWLIAAVLGITIIVELGTAISPNVFFVLTGLIGFSIGLAPMPSRIIFRNHFAAVAGFLALCFVMNILSGHVLAYSLGIALLLKVVYDKISIADGDGHSFRMMILMGKYSLFCYIFQIAFLHGIHRLWPGWFHSVSYQLPLMIFLTTATLVATCICLDRMRREFSFMEKTYRFVFA